MWQNFSTRCSLASTRSHGAVIVHASVILDSRWFLNAFLRRWMNFNSQCNCYVLIQFTNASGKNKVNPFDSSRMLDPMGKRIIGLNPAIYPQKILCTLWHGVETFHKRGKMLFDTHWGSRFCKAFACVHIWLLFM